MAARAMAASLAARPALKLRFTGILPASSTPRLAMVAPRPGGRTMPIRFSGTFFLSHRERTMPTVSSSPPVSARFPAWASMSTVEKNFLRKPRRAS